MAPFYREKSEMCYTHPSAPAVGECCKCHRRYCSKCLRIHQGSLYCIGCARSLVPKSGLYISLSFLSVIPILFFLYLFSSGGSLSIIAGIGFVFFIVFAAIMYKKSYDGIPPSLSSADGYAALLEASIVHETTHTGSDPFPNYDDRGNPLIDSTDIILSGHSQNKFGSEAQDSMEHVEINDQVWLKHDRTNSYDSYAIYAESKYGQYLGWIPDIKRYKEYKESLADAFKDPLHSSALAFVSDKFVDDDGFCRIQLTIARYSAPTFASEKHSQSKKAKVSDPAAEIAKYKSLLDSGAITQDEYNQKKQQLLDL